MGKRTWKKLLAIAMALVLMMSVFTACGKKEQPISDEVQEWMDETFDGQEVSSVDDLDDLLNEYYDEDSKDAPEAYRNYNKALTYSVPEIVPGRTLVSKNWELRVVLTLAEPFSGSFRHVHGVGAESSGDTTFYGFMDEGNTVAIKGFKDRHDLQVMIYLSPVEYYDVSIKPSVGYIGQTEIARKGNWTLYENMTFSDGSDLISVNDYPKVHALMTYTDESENYNDGEFHGTSAAVTITAHGEKADAKRAFETLFDVDILHNRHDSENMETAYTMDGKEVSLVGALRPEDAVLSTLEYYGLKMPDNAATPGCGLFLEVGLDDDSEYDFSFGLCTRGYYSRAAVITKELKNGALVHVMKSDITGGCSITLETTRESDLPEGISAEDTMYDGQMYVYMIVSLHGVDDSDPESVLERFVGDFGLD